MMLISINSIWCTLCRNAGEKLLIQAESFDEQAYIALHEANQQNFTALALARAKKKHAVFNVLTTEQQEKWLKIMKKQQRKKAHRKSRASNK